MPSPFPGMDPYLETPLLWPDVHHGIISQIQGVLNPRLRPKYVARVEMRVYVSDEEDPGREAIVPDVRVSATGAKKSGKSKAASAIAKPEPMTILLDDEIEEARVEIKHVQSGSLVTVIEVVSPTNKIRGATGRRSFLDKRQEVIHSTANWVEIDLLRGGTPTVSNLAASDYRVCVWRNPESGKRQAYYWPIYLRQRLPVVGIPLRGDADVPLELEAVLAAAYENGAYDMSIDYSTPPDPPLDDEDAAWANEMIGKRRSRRNGPRKTGSN